MCALTIENIIGPPLSWPPVAPHFELQGTAPSAMLTSPFQGMITFSNNTPFLL